MQDGREVGRVRCILTSQPEKGLVRSAVSDEERHMFGFASERFLVAQKRENQIREVAKFRPRSGLQVTVCGRALTRSLCSRDRAYTRNPGGLKGLRWLKFKFDLFSNFK